MSAGTTQIRFDVRKAGTVVTPMAGKVFELASSALGIVSGTQTVRVTNPITDYLDIIYVQSGAMTGTPVFSSSAGQQGRLSIQWIGF